MITDGPDDADALHAFAHVYESLPSHRSSGGPARGTIAVALVALDHRKSDFNLNLQSHRAQGGSQMKGTTPANVHRILRQFGESRTFLGEGGRTNRGGPGDVGAMLRAIESLRLDRSYEPVVTR